jgi:hypothetical protein
VGFEIGAMPNFPYNTHINWSIRNQWINYNNIDFKQVNPIIARLFTPTPCIQNIIHNIETKYHPLFNSGGNSGETQWENSGYSNICVLFFRGNDKETEVRSVATEPYESYYQQIFMRAEKIFSDNPNIIFLIQSDETEFIDEARERFPHNSFYFKDEIIHIPKRCELYIKPMEERNFEYSKWFLAITIIMSKCKYIVCNTGNCPLWIILFRGNTDGVFQIGGMKDLVACDNVFIQQTFVF